MRVLESLGALLETLRSILPLTAILVFFSTSGIEKAY